MEYRIIGLITLVCFVAYLGGCTTGRFIPLEEYQENPKRHYTILAAMTTDSTLYEFRKVPERVKVADGNLTGKLKNGDTVSIPLDDIGVMKVEKLKVAETVILSAVLLGIVVIAAVGSQYANMNLDMNWNMDEQ